MTVASTADQVSFVGIEFDSNLVDIWMTRNATYADYAMRTKWSLSAAPKIRKIANYEAITGFQPRAFNPPRFGKLAHVHMPLGPPIRPSPKPRWQPSTSDEPAPTPPPRPKPFHYVKGADHSECKNQ